MNKTELVEKIAAGAGLSKVDSKKALEATIANPATKEKIKIAAKKVAKFKPGQELADAI